MYAESRVYFVCVFSVCVGHEYKSIESPTEKADAITGTIKCTLLYVVHENQKSEIGNTSRRSSGLAILKSVDGIHLPTAATFPSCTRASGIFLLPLPQFCVDSNVLATDW